MLSVVGSGEFGLFSVSDLPVDTTTVLQIARRMKNSLRYELSGPQ